jgi:hypothetical protein
LSMALSSNNEQRRAEWTVGEAGRVLRAISHRRGRENPSRQAS